MKKILIIFGVALFIRLLLVAVWVGTGNQSRQPADSKANIQIAYNLQEGRGFELFGEPTSRRGLGYPLFLAPFLKAGTFPLGVQIAHAVLGSLTCVFLFLIGRHLESEKIGILASGILASDYLLAKQTVYILPEVTTIFLLFSSLYCLYRARQKSAVGWSLLSGILGGLTVLTKESFIFYFPLLLVFLVLPFRRKTFFAALIFLLGFMGALLPWVARNRMVYGEGVFLTIGSGRTLYLGNNPDMTGRIHGGEWSSKKDTDYPHRDPKLPPILPLEADQYLREKAVRYIIAHPFIFLRNMGIKALNLWFPYYSEGHPWAKGISLLQYLLVIPLAVYGMILKRKRWRDYLPLYLLIFYLTLLHSMTIPGIRYRYPAMPALMVFTACGAVTLWYKLNNIWKEKFEKEL